MQPEGTRVSVVLDVEKLEPVIDERIRRLAVLSPPPVALNQAALAEALDVSIPTLRRLIDDGMPYMLVGDYKRFDRQRVFDWLHERSKVSA